MCLWQEGTLTRHLQNVPMMDLEKDSTDTKTKFLRNTASDNGHQK